MTRFPNWMIYPVDISSFDQRLSPALISAAGMLKPGPHLLLNSADTTHSCSFNRTF